MGPGADSEASSVLQEGSGGEGKTDLAGEKGEMAVAVTLVWERGWAPGPR